jgi:uncharacterized protein (TIGR02594 family)
MRTIIMMASLLLFATSLATPASARHRAHARHHQVSSEFQPPWLASASDSAVTRPSRRARTQRAVPAFSGPALGGPDFRAYEPQMTAVPEPTPRRTRRQARRAAIDQPTAMYANAPAFQQSAVSMADPGSVQPARRSRQQRAQFASNGAASGGFTSFGGSSLVDEARRWMGGNPTGRSSLWCGNFMNFVLERTGHQASPSNQARSFASYGQRLPGPQVGAIAVMSRGRSGGHVGVVSGIDPNGNPIIISGNHGRRVAESVYSRGRIYAYVMP